MHGSLVARRANVGDLRRTDDGAVIQVRGKGGKDRRIPVERALVQVLERYLDSRAARVPADRRRGNAQCGQAEAGFPDREQPAQRSFPPSVPAGRGSRAAMHST
jgi:integrase